MYFAIKRCILSGIKYFCIAMIWTMSAVILAGVFCRFVLLTPLVWGEELSLTCVVWLTFVGSALAFELNSHVIVDLASNLVHDSGKRVIRLIVSFLIIPLSAFLAVAGYVMMQQTRNSITPGLNISVAVLYTPALLGGILMFWLACEKFVYALLSIVSGRDIVPPLAILPPVEAAVAPERPAEGGTTRC